MLPTSALRSFMSVAGSVLAVGLVEVHLIKTPVSLTPSMVTADFDEADFTGYAAISIDQAGAAWDNDEGDAVLSFDGVHFQPTDAVTPNTIYGYYITTDVAAFGGAGSLLRAELFDTPVPMASAADALDFAPVLRVGQPIAG